MHGTVTLTGNSIGDTATYICDSGFELIGNASVTCTQVDVNSAAFTPAVPVCRRECCMNGFLLADVYVTCYHVHCVNSRFYIALFSTALCTDPPDVMNGTVTFTGNTVGDTATFTCDPGFELIGNASVTCTQVDVNSATFAPTVPVCRREC